MQPLPPLPVPNEAALQHSCAVKELIHAELAAAGGWISFAHYMKLALYAPGLGYYSGGAAKFGLGVAGMVVPVVARGVGTAGPATVVVTEAVASASNGVPIGDCHALMVALP